MGEPSRKRVTYAQLDHLWEFLIKHKSLAMGHNKTAQAREFSRRMWEEIALHLNAHGDGAVKNWKGWCKYWNDFKSKLKKSAATANLSQQRTGGGPSSTKTMTDLEKKYLQILGHDFGTGLPGIRVEPFEELIELEVLVESDISQPGSSQEVTLPSFSPEQPTFRRSPRKTAPPQPKTPPPQPKTPPLQPKTPPQSRIPPNVETPAATTRHSPRRPRNLIPTFSPYPLAPSPLPALPSPCPATAPSPAPPVPTPSPRPPVPTTARRTSVPSAERRRRTRQEPPMTPEVARRTLIAQSQRMTTIEEQKLEVMKQLLEELRDIKEMIRAKFNDPPADVE